MGESKHVIFCIGEEEYGIDISNVKGIERQMDIVPVPNRPEYLLGIITLRNSIIPVFSLGKKFDHEEADTEETRLIVTTASGIMVAFKVDAVSEIIDIPQSDMFDLPLEAQCEDTLYAGKVAHIGRRIIIILNLEHVLDSEERMNISKMMSEVNTD